MKGLDMGATGWQYYTPYQEDMMQVLDTLQNDVFASGDYNRPRADLGELDQIFECDEEYHREELEKYGLLADFDRLGGYQPLRDWLQSLNQAETINTREELHALMCLDCDGTGSILDIDNVYSESQGWGLYPLSPSLLQKLFGTDRPTREQIERLHAERGSLEDALYAADDRATKTRFDPEYVLHRRGEGIYIVLYKDDKPNEIYIEGSSGD